MMIELSRLARAVHADVDRIDSHHYRVRRADHIHLVDLTAPLGAECDCADYRIRGSACVHLLAVMLAEGDRDVIRSLRVLVRYPGALRLIRAA
jgi:SWIM zinc finger